MDVFQQRYLAHQARKAKVLAELLAERYSERVFDDRPVDPDLLADLLKVAERAPSSCDRRGVSAKPVTDRDGRALLGGLLVGGVGWVHRAPAILLLFGDPAAYKAPGEAAFMPYLDAGVIVGHLYLTAAAVGLRCCFINPNIREHNRDHFANVFGGGIFCGALAVGWSRGDQPDWVGDTS